MKLSQKVDTAVLTLKMTCFQIAQKSPNIWATFVKNCHQELSKIAQSGHTGGDQQCHVFVLPPSEMFLPLKC